MDWSPEKFKSEERLGAPITFGSNLPEYRKMFESQGEKGSQVRALLIGVGSETSAAEWQRFLRDRGVNTLEQFVLDISMVPLAEAQKLWKEGYHPEDIDQTFEKVPPVRFIQGDAKQLPFSSNSFDAVFTHLLGLNLDDFEAVLKNAKSVLKPEGRILLVEHPQVFAKNISPTDIDNLIKQGQKEAFHLLDRLGYTDIEVFPAVGLTRRQYMKETGRWTHNMDHHFVDRTPSTRLAIKARK